MTTSTQTPPKVATEPPNSEFEESNSEEIGRHWFALAIVMALIFVAVVIGVFIATRGDDGQTEREVTRSKAEAVLRARFNDTSSSVGPLQTITVTWKGDQLIADWVQGDTTQKKCTAPVLVSADGQNFGIASFTAVPFDKQGAAPATCVSTQGLEFGLPLEPKKPDAP